MMQWEDRMSTKTRWRYTEEFKAEAVQLIRDSAQPVARVARDLSVTDHLLYRWRAEERQAGSAGHTRQSLRVEHEELTWLRRENVVLKHERVCFKRAAVFLAKGSR